MRIIMYSYVFFRYRLSEISFVLKAVTTLVISMKRASVGKGSYNNTLREIYSKLCPISQKTPQLGNS